jgi:phosphoribosylformylglycinamidine synthase
MRTIRNQYRELSRDPTDLELETFAQTWSEHCVHKTLKSAVRYVGASFPAHDRGSKNGAPASADAPTAGNVLSGEVTIEYENLLRDTIARATRELIAAGKVNWCLSVFEDNAGIIAFDEQYGIAFKAETHNHPSAIEPYGGAATGIGGCIRDVMGCGLGAKPIANTDIFCVANPDFPADALPRGVLHPRRILKGVVSGVRDYGNRMGIPTVNGAIVFDDRYLGNPLVFCGCIGLIPRNRISKEPRPGDLIVVIGGRTGRDGIHGATFSSAELTDTHADEFSHAVQIGNAITQKQVLDAQLAARDHTSGCL